MAKGRFFQYIDQLWQLRVWKMQLLDENHLCIKSSSEDCSSPEGHRSITGIFFPFLNLLL